MTRDTPIARPTRRPWWTAVAIGAIALFAALHAWSAARTKAPTFDETVHAFSSWLIVNHADFRVNPEHPPLWKYVAGVPLIGMPLPAYDSSSPQAAAVLKQVDAQWDWCLDTLFGTPDAPRSDGLALVARARGAIVIFLALLVLIVGRWAYVWGGSLAAIVSASLVALEPNLIAHGGLVTNDVAAATVITLAAYLTWRLGERFSVARAALLALTIAAAFATKFTAFLVVPMLGLPLIYRAAAGGGWSIGRAGSIRRLVQTAHRFALVGAMVAAGALVSFAMLWTLYGFRAAPTPQGESFDGHWARWLLAHHTILSEAIAANGYKPVAIPAARYNQQIQSFQPGLGTQIAYAIGDLHVLPQAYTYGIDFANARSVDRYSFFLGEPSNYGHLAYFPVAMAVKTPLTLIVLVVGCGIAGTWLLIRRRRPLDLATRWKLVCLLVPPVIYLAATMASQLNLGVRHVLPLYPPAIVAVGVVLARLARGAPRIMKIVVPASIALLAGESLGAFPDDLSYFNLAAGGTRGGARLLSDSNLDWGQDLSGLGDWYRNWRAQNPTTPFYLAYFGSTVPRAYGIDFVNTVPGFAGNPAQPATSEIHHGVFAISLTYLQGMCPPAMRPAMQRLMQTTPIATIHDTIRIYQIDDLVLGPPAATQPASQPATTPSR